MSDNHDYLRLADNIENGYGSEAADMIRDLVARAEAAEARAAEARACIEFILPMAKGYAAVNNVGSNQEYVRSAEEFCRAFPQEQSDG